MLGPTFEDRFDTAPNWQQQRYQDLEISIKTELTEIEKIYLLGIAGGEAEGVVVFINLFSRLQQGN